MDQNRIKFSFIFIGLAALDIIDGKVGAALQEVPFYFSQG